MIYTPKNSRFNREANLLKKKISLIERRNGLAIFAVIEEGGENIYCSCEESLFDKEFSPEAGTGIPSDIKIPVVESKDLKNIKFKRYPADLKTEL